MRARARAEREARKRKEPIEHLMKRRRCKEKGERVWGEGNEIERFIANRWGKTSSDG
jgi:hypothetical protein